MEDKTAEATDSLSKDTGGIVGLDRPLDSLDLTKILAKEFEEKEQESEEPSQSGGVVAWWRKRNRLVKSNQLRNQSRRRPTPNTIFLRTNRKGNPNL